LTLGIVEVRAGRDVVFPSMPRTRDRGAVEIAFSERTAAMLAGVVDRKKLSPALNSAICRPAASTVLPLSWEYPPPSRL